jgi:hypothetical protein
MGYTWRKMPQHQYDPGEPDKPMWCVVFMPDDEVSPSSILPGRENWGLTEEAAKKRVDELIAKSERS